jgi:poly(3-hydroxybutyrate) depolymerase
MICCASLAVLLVPSAPSVEKLTSGGRERTYHLYVPRVSAEGEALPLIVLLHGSGRRGDSLLALWESLARRERFAIAAPDSASRTAWVMPDDGPEFLYDVVESVRKSHKVNGRAIYLFGHSAGAVFALYMGLLESQYFAAVAVHAGAFREEQEFVYIERAKRKIPFAVWLGAEDTFFPLAASRRTRDAFLAQGLPFHLTEIPNHTHNAYYSRPSDINGPAWSFLKQHVLESDPHYERYEFSR